MWSIIAEEYPSEIEEHSNKDYPKGNTERKESFN